MTDISSIGHGPVSPAGGLHRSASPASSDPSVARTARPGAEGADRVELSDHARLMNRLRELPDIRSDRVKEIRRQIVAGTYETDDKLNIAISRLIESFID